MTDAFVVIALLDLGVPGWAVAVSALGVAVVGHIALRRRVESFCAAPDEKKAPTTASASR